MSWFNSRLGVPDDAQGWQPADGGALRVYAGPQDKGGGTTVGLAFRAD